MAASLRRKGSEKKGNNKSLRGNQKGIRNPKRELRAKAAADYSSEGDVLTKHTARLFDLQHQIEAAKKDPAVLKEIEPNIFSAIRESIAAIFSINLAFTYEEFEEKIGEQDFDAQLKEKAQKVASDLNSLEYSQSKSYEELIGIVDDLINLYYAYFDGKIPKTEKKKKRKSVARAVLMFLWRVFKGITFIIWFPFYISAVSLKNFNQRRHLAKDPSYKITGLIARGERQIRRKKLVTAVNTYEKIEEEYASASSDLKAIVREKIIEFYSEIMREHAKLVSGND